VGLLQYIAPTIQLLTAIFVFREAFTTARVIGFSMIWAALVIYAIHGVLSAHRPPENGH
jgi:chloramphenicol-sensitive protein RarD